MNEIIQKIDSMTEAINHPKTNKGQIIEQAFILCFDCGQLVQNIQYHLEQDINSTELKEILPQVDKLSTSIEKVLSCEAELQKQFHELHKDLQKMRHSLNMMCNDSQLSNN